MRILLVEDHEDTARVMSRLLSRLGYTVEAAGTCAAALELAGAQSFDLVISDLGLPDGNGLELMRRLLERGPIRGIALTGFGMDEDVKETRAAGFVHHLTKPVSVEDLESAIDRVMK